MKISVTQEHIDKGVAGLCGSCPVARALLSAGWVKPWVGTEFIRDRFSNARYPTPEAVQDFIVSFDEGKRVQPFEFELEG